MTTASLTVGTADLEKTMALKVNNTTLFNSIPLINRILVSPGLSVPTLYELNVAVAKADAAIRVVAKMRDDLFKEHTRAPVEGEVVPGPGQAPLLTPEGLQKVTELFQLESEIDVNPISVSKLEKLTTLRNPEEEITGVTLQPLMWLLTA